MKCVLLEDPYFGVVIMIEDANQTLKEKNFVLVTPKQVCVLLGISNTTLWRLTRNDDHFPRGIKITNRKTLFRYSDLITWANSLDSSLCKNVTTGREKEVEA